MVYSYNYKGLTIHENFDSQFGTPYFTVINVRKRDRMGKLLHAHTSNKKCAEAIADCFNELKNHGACKGFNLTVRNKAMRLSGSYIKMK